MCGIIGYTGNKNSKEVLLNGLKTLEYRGYDSAGVFLVKNKEYKIIKSVGKISELEKKLDQETEVYNLGLGHTRWATHGEVNETNSHPHRCGQVTLVHNGIIENYKEIKEELEKKGYKFKTQTDTEVLCGLIDSYFKKDKLETLNNILKEIRGSFALGIVFDDEMDTIYAIRKDSPLIIGIGEDENFIASDISAILEYTKDYILLEEKEIAKITKNKVVIFDKKLKEVEKEISHAAWDKTEALKGGFDHFMIKEIYEQPDLLDKIISKYIDGYEFNEEVLDLSKYNKIDIVACGSAYHAGLIGKKLYENYISDKITIDVASEYRYKKHYFNQETLVIVISQSGETADTLAALRLAKENNVDTLAIVNVISSTIAREAKYLMPMLAGPEISVATTKGYFSQVAILIVLMLKNAYNLGTIDEFEKDKIIKELRILSKKAKEILEIKEQYQELAKKIYKKSDIYFIARGIDYDILLEANLKVKEISYIHGDCYQAGELKHGSIALIDKNTPVVALITEKSLSEKTISNIVEAKTRGADIIIIATDNIKIDKDITKEIFTVPEVNDFCEPLLAIIPFQLIAYYIAKYKECDIDKPRNLAKSVTVE